MYKPNHIGLMIADNPAQAYQELKQLFQRDKSISVLSSNLGVDRHTVALWIRRLVTLGFGDPRESQKKISQFPAHSGK